jgi:hypothetical protein
MANMLFSDTDTVVLKSCVTPKSAFDDLVAASASLNLKFKLKKVDKFVMCERIVLTFISFV